MKIHLRQIPPEGLHLEGEEECVIPELEPEGIRCAGPMRYKIDIGLSGDALWANGTISQPLDLQCVSCLTRFVQEVTVTGFAVHEELTGPEVIDLAPAMREEILLNLPVHPHCDADGTRECKPVITTGLPADEQDGGAAKRDRDWGALDRLKLRE